MLASLISTEIYGFLLIVVRFGAAMVVMPGFGEPFINTQFRLAIVLVISLALTPVLAPALPDLPPTATGIMILLMGETLVGFFLGITARIMMSALQTAGVIIAMTSGMANAMTQDITSAQQGSIVGSLMSTIGLLTVFALNLHHLLLMAIIDSYTLFVPGQAPPVENFTEMVTNLVSQSFALGLQLAAPFVAIGIVFNVGLGLMSRLMPAMQIFFIAIPLQIILGMAVLTVAMPIMMHWFIRAFEMRIFPFLIP